jgi:hypothetical protein
MNDSELTIFSPPGPKRGHTLKAHRVPSLFLDVE